MDISTDLKKIAPLIAKEAPLLGGLIGGPAGSLIAELVTTALGLPHTASSDDISNAIQSDPDASAKLTALQYAHEEALVALQEKFSEDSKDDVQDARRASLLVRHAWIMPFLAIVYVIGFFVIVALVLSGKIQKDAQILADVHTIVSYIIGFYFGSSYTEHIRNSQ